MTKKLLTLAAIAAMFAVSCNKEQNVETTPEIPSTEKSVTLRANVDDPETKVSADNVGAFKWQNGDAITIVTNNGNTRTFTTEDSNTSADFSGLIPQEDEIGAYALYPASEDHVVVDNEIGFNLDDAIIWRANASNMPMVGKITGGNAEFKAVGGVLKLVLYNIPSTAKHLQFIAKNKKITGNFEIADATQDNLAIVTEAKDDKGNNELFIDFSENYSANKVFYIPLPTGTIDGFTINLLDTGLSTLFTQSTKDGVNIEVAANKLIIGPALNCAPMTVLLSEDFSSYDNNGVPSGTVGGVSYSCTDGSTTSTNLKKGNSENYAGGETPEILIGKSSGTFKISGIGCDGIASMTLTFKKNNKALTVSATEGITVTGATSGAGTKIITLTNAGIGTPKVPLTSFDLTFTAGGDNVRVDDILLTVPPVAYTAPSITTGVETLTVGVGQASKTTSCTLSNAVDGLGISTIVTGDDTSWIESVVIADGNLTLTPVGANVSGADYTATLTLKATGATSKVVTLKQTNSLVPNPSVSVTPGNAKFSASWTGDAHATDYVAYLRTTDSAPVDGSGDPTTGTTDITSSISESEGVYSITDYAATNDQEYFLYVKVNEVSSKYTAPSVFVKKTFTPTGATPTISMNTTSITNVAAAGVSTTAASAYVLLNGASNNDVTITCDGTVVTAASKNATAGTINYTVSANTGAARNGWIKVQYSSEDPHQITVSQLAGETITSGTFDGDSESINMMTASGITITQLKNNSTNVNTSYNTVSTLRVYRANQMKFEGKTFTKIEMHYTSTYSGADWSVIQGGGTVSIDTSNKKVVWTNSNGASTVILQNSTSDGTNTQLRTTQFYFEY